MKKILFKSAIPGILTLLVMAGCNNNDQSGNNTIPPEPAPPILNYSVISTYPHDTSFFTEGLEFHEGNLFESSGGEKEVTPHPSAFGILDLKSGKVDIKVNLDNSVYFGEGITVFKDKIYQLTWRNRKGFVYDAVTFKKLQEFNYQGDGWGLTHDSSRLIMSNGSSNLQFLHPETFKVESILSVTDNNGPVGNINELEFTEGFIYANQWQTNYILKIDPTSGKVIGKLNLDGLANETKNRAPKADVLNGIAYNPQTKTFFITGKLWPLLYEVRVN